MNKIIAISAISGGGKTTLVNETAQLLKAPKLFFDDYFKKEHYPQNSKKWLIDGADLNSWVCPEFAQDLQLLKSGVTIIQKWNNNKIIPGKLLIVEEPTGRRRKEIRELIDYVILIDTPPEISLARRLKRLLDPIPIEKLKDYPKDEIIKGFSEYVNFNKGYLRDYIDHGSVFYIEIFNQVKQDADLILDWRLTPLELAKKIREFLQQKK